MHTFRSMIWKQCKANSKFKDKYQLSIKINPHEWKLKDMLAPFTLGAYIRGCVNQKISIVHRICKTRIIQNARRLK